MGNLGLTEGFLFFVFVVVGLVFGGLSGYVAQEKGYRVSVWFAIGFIFNLAGLIASAGLPDKNARPQDEQA